MAPSGSHPTANPYRPHETWLTNHLKTLRKACDDKTRRNKRMSPLLRLPAQVRRTIWEYALGNYRIRISFRGVTCSQLDNPFGRRLHSADTITNLSRLCRQTHTETQLLPFSLGNEFAFASPPDVAVFCRRASPEQRNAITRVRTQDWAGMIKDRRDWKGMRQVAEGMLYVFREIEGVKRVTLEVITTRVLGYGVLGTMAFGERNRVMGKRGGRIEVRMVLDAGARGNYPD